MNPYGIGKLNLKRCNRKQILSLLITQGPMSRIDIANRLHLTRAAITIIANEMLEEGVLVADSSASSDEIRRGRKKILLQIAPNYKLVFGAFIDQDQICVGLSNLNGDVLSRRLERLSRPVRLDQIFQLVIRLVNAIKSENFISNDQILGMGVGIPSHLQPLVSSSAAFNDLVEQWKTSLQLHVVAESQTAALALANIAFGSAQNTSEDLNRLALIRFGEQIESAMIFCDALDYEPSQNPIDFAHMIVDSHSNHVCPSCGLRGCLHSIINQLFLERQIDSIYSAKQTPYLYSVLGPNAVCPGKQAIVQSSLWKDSGVERVFSHACDFLAVALINVFQIFNPQKLVLTGSMLENQALADYLFRSLAQRMPKDMANRLCSGSISSSNTFLSGCFVAIRQLFIDRGGLSVDEP